MSGDCDYPVKDLPELSPIKDPEPLLEVASKNMKNTPSPQHQEEFQKLIEYQDMVEVAETNCLKLKKELDRLKHIYVKQNTKMKKNLAKNSNFIKEKIELFNTSDNTDSKERQNLAQSSSILPKTKMNLIRQNSNQISTDDTGAALGTINNILSDITKSINFYEIHPHREFKEEKYGKFHNISVNNLYDSNFHGIEDIKVTKYKQEENDFERSKFLKHKPKKTASKSSTMKKNKLSKPKYVAKKLRLNDVRSDFTLGNKSVPVLHKRSRRGMKRPRPEYKGNDRLSKNSTKKSKAYTSKDLVEIYHNEAVKECNSSDVNINAKTSVKQDVPMRIQTTVPPLNLNGIGKYDEREGTRLVLSTFSRNYELPTIASRLKQVAKFYMDKFNMKTIPFCTAISTSPSHNIGIKIQQVMNMLKTRQPAENITLAYNIGLAAERLNNKPISALASNLTSKIRSECPLSKSLNFQKLREMAKAIPEEDAIQETDEELEDHVSVHSLIITGPSGDMKIKKVREPVWSTDLNNSNNTCTCIEPHGANLDQVVNKCKLNNGSNLLTTPAKPKIKAPVKKTMPRSKMNLIKNTVKPKENKPVVAPIEKTTPIPLEGREQRIKEVLQKLYTEFDSLNKKHEELGTKANLGNATDETLKEIDCLEKELNGKEEEIGMVVNLYNEILALKKQVKSLREKTSKEAISIKSSRLNSSTTASHLTNLLQQIQHYQAHYKKN